MSSKRSEMAAADWMAVQRPDKFDSRDAYTYQVLCSEYTPYDVPDESPPANRGLYPRRLKLFLRRPELFHFCGSNSRAKTS